MTLHFDFKGLHVRLIMYALLAGGYFDPDDYVTPELWEADLVYTARRLARLGLTDE